MIFMSYFESDPSNLRQEDTIGSLLTEFGL